MFFAKKRKEKREYYPIFYKEHNDLKKMNEIVNSLNAKGIKAKIFIAAGEVSAHVFCFKSEVPYINAFLNASYEAQVGDVPADRFSAWMIGRYNR